MCVVVVAREPFSRGYTDFSSREAVPRFTALGRVSSAAAAAGTLCNLGSLVIASQQDDSCDNALPDFYTRLYSAGPPGCRAARYAQQGFRSSSQSGNKTADEAPSNIISPRLAGVESDVAVEPECAARP